MSEQERRAKPNSILSSVIDLIAEDPEFREALKYDPAEAMKTAGFTSQLDDDDDEVVGFAQFAPMFGLSGPTLTSPTTPAATIRIAEGSVPENRYLSYTWETSGSCTVHKP